MTDEEKLTVRLGMLAMHGAREFLRRHHYPEPTEDQAREIARKAQPVIAELVASDLEDGEELIRRAVAAGIAASGHVMGLVPPSEMN